jgi:hypothetical protein
MIASKYSNSYSSIETVKLLLEHPDININLKNNKGEIASTIAFKHSNNCSSYETYDLLSKYST